MKLSEQLLNLQQQSIKNRTEVAVNQMREATLNLKETGIEKTAKSSGDFFDNAVLLNSKSEKIDLYELLGNKKAIINFYRGSWCPYCNLELKTYESLLNNEENKDVFMIAISPEMPDLSIDENDISNLKFTVLSDEDNKLATDLRIMMHLPETIQSLYGEKVVQSTGKHDYNLPLPATYVIDGNKKIIKAWVDADYTKRAEPSEVIDCYKQLLV